MHQTLRANNVVVNLDEALRPSAININLRRPFPAW